MFLKISLIIHPLQFIFRNYIFTHTQYILKQDKFHHIIVMV